MNDPLVPEETTIPLALARDKILHACTEASLSQTNLAHVKDVFETFDMATRFLVARSLSSELLLTMMFTGGLYEPILTLLFSSIASIPDSPNAGVFGAANDLATEYLLQKMGIDEVIGNNRIDAIDLTASTEQFDEWVQATCPLAIDGLAETYLPLFQEHQKELARSICVALMERRYLRAARSMRWFVLLEPDESILQFRDEALHWLPVFSHRYREIGFHLEVIRRYFAGERHR